MTLIISVAYTAYFIKRGWIPHDEGTLAQSAERVLAGELPHRDFIDGYTGGLTYLNALAFTLFGTRLVAMRYLLFLAFAGWVLVFYHVARKVLPTLAAVVITLIAVVWSVPNYPAALPSWYILFLSTCGLAALMQYIDTSRHWWLLLAGVSSGLSVLMKSPGVMILAAGVLFLLYHEAQRGAGAPDAPRGGVLVQLGIVSVLLAAFLSLVVIGTSRKEWLDVYQFVAPCSAMVVIVARRVYAKGLPSRAVCRGTVRAVTPFVFGAAFPLALFLAYYVAKRALPDLVRDILVLPARTLVGASLTPPIPIGLFVTAVVAFVAWELRRSRGRLAALQDGLGFAVVVLMLVPTTAVTIEPFVWASLATSTPVVVVVMAFLIARQETQVGPSRTTSQQVLVGCVASFCSLIQYPFAAPIYFAYSLPLLLLAVVVLVQMIDRARQRALQGIAVAYLAFGALYVTPLKVSGLLGPMVRDDVAELDLRRGGLLVSRQDATSYASVSRTLRAHASSGVIFAGPDAPEIYFLSELRNPTPAMFDYLMPDTLFHLHLVQRLDSLRVNAVAIKHRVWHSPKLSTEIQDSLARRFPASRDIGDFTVRWR